MSDYYDQPEVELKKASLTVLAVCAAFFLFIIFCMASYGVTKGLQNPSLGKIGVVRNGGPFDNKNIKGIIQGGSGVKYTGLYSTTHYYPSNQRNFILAPDSPDTPGADEFKTPTKDSVNIGVEGQVLFTLNTNKKTLESFDNRYGTRTNPLNGNNYYPWEGDNGWQAELDTWSKPTINNKLREIIARYNCAELNAQCALVKSANVNKIRNIGADDIDVNFEKIQNELKKSLETDLAQTLGEEYFLIQKVNITKSTLPNKTQNAVDEANAEKAGVSTQKYIAQQAKYRAKAALIQARANKDNPYAGIEQVFKALPDGSQPIINLSLGGGRSKSLNLGFNK